MVCTRLFGQLRGSDQIRSGISAASMLTGVTIDGVASASNAAVNELHASLFPLARAKKTSDIIPDIAGGEHQPAAKKRRFARGAGGK